MGGFVIGMGAQVFILPYLDSITGFLVLFICVTALSSWIFTSSPRLSYFGMQVAFAFYLINLQEFRFQTSLSVARDRVVGILLGLFMMWLIFDQVWGVPARLEMKRVFAANLRLIAQFARGPISRNIKTAIGRSLALRETISTNLDKARALADGVLFEFGPSRQKDLQMRDLIRQWQPQLRTLFILRVAFWKYRAQLPGFELPDAVCVTLIDYDDHSAGILESLAESIEGRAPDIADSIGEAHELLNEAVGSIQSAGLSLGRAQSLIALLRTIDGVAESLAIAIDAGFTRLRSI